MRLEMGKVRRARVKMVVGCLLAVMVFLPVAWAQAEDAIKVVASQASQSKMQAFIDFLQKNQIDVEKVEPKDFANVKSSEFLAIEGGMDDPGMKALITEVVGATDAKSLSKAGAKQMFVKEGVFKPGQKILVFAGSNAEDAAAARVENREEWMPHLKKWFQLEDGPQSIGGY